MQKIPTVGLIFVLPFLIGPAFAHADFTEVSIPAPRAVILTLKAVVPDSPQLVAPVLALGTAVEIRWQSDAQGVTPCITNFVGTGTPAPQAKDGTVAGTLTKTRDFIVSCGGKTAKIRLTVGAVNLVVSKAGVKSGLVQKFDARGKKIADTYIGNATLVFQGAIANSGNLNMANKISAWFTSNGEVIAASQNNDISPLRAKKGRVVTYSHSTGPGDGTAFKFKFCAKEVGQPDDKIKCKEVPKTYKFLP